MPDEPKRARMRQRKDHTLRASLALQAEDGTDGLLDIGEKLFHGIALRGAPRHRRHFGPKSACGCLVNEDFNLGGTDAHNFDSFVRQRSAPQMK
jgi:hypothetical protein